VPSGDWRGATLRVTGLKELPLDWQEWLNIPVDWRAKILPTISQNTLDK